MLNFNSHAHVERDYANDDIKIWNDDFNSHAHVERDHGCIVPCCAVDNFNSHAHVERDIIIQPKSTRGKNFNSHAHVERDSAIYANMAVLPISTHTLTWSVTNLRCQRLYSGGISTHTLTWSVTIMPFASLSTSIFQLTRSRGA